jgi:hypothetical protein
MPGLLAHGEFKSWAESAFNVSPVWMICDECAVDVVGISITTQIKCNYEKPSDLSLRAAVEA